MLEKVGKRDRERVVLVLERNSDLLPPEYSPTGDGTGNLDMYPDPALNPQPLSAGKMLQLTEPYWPGL